MKPEIQQLFSAYARAVPGVYSDIIAAILVLADVLSQKPPEVKPQYEDRNWGEISRR